MKLKKDNTLYQEDLNRILQTKGIERLKEKSILLSGGTGLIGLCLVDALMKYNKTGAGIKMYVIGRNMEKAASRLGEYFDSPFFCFIEQDVRQPLPDDLKVDYIIPLASNTHPLAYSRFPIETIEINVKGVVNVLKKACDCGAEILYPSSVEIYGNARGNEVFLEQDTGVLDLSTSRSCYTESKRVCEALCQSYMDEKKVNVKIIRLCRVFGPTMIESDSKASSQFIKNALMGEDIILKSAGNQYYSYMYVADAVSAILHVMLNGETGKPYNISSSTCNIHLKEFAQTCARTVSRNVIVQLPSVMESKGFSIATKALLDNTRLMDTGWNPRYDYEMAIERTIKILK